MQYISVAAGQSDAPLGAVGQTSPGDTLAILVCIVETASASLVTLKGGSGSAITIMPDNVAAGIGVYPVQLHMTSKTGQFSLTTDSGVKCIAVGTFK